MQVKTEKQIFEQYKIPESSQETIRELLSALSKFKVHQDLNELCKLLNDPAQLQNQCLRYPAMAFHVMKDEWLRKKLPFGECLPFNQYRRYLDAAETGLACAGISLCCAPLTVPVSLLLVKSLALGAFAISIGCSPVGLVFALAGAITLAAMLIAFVGGFLWELANEPVKPTVKHMADSYGQMRKVLKVLDENDEKAVIKETQKSFMKELQQIKDDLTKEIEGNGWLFNLFRSNSSECKLKAINTALNELEQTTYSSAEQLLVWKENKLRNNELTCNRNGGFSQSRTFKVLSGLSFLAPTEFEMKDMNSASASALATVTP